MRTQQRRMIPVLVLGLLLVAACNGAPAEAPSAGPAGSLCKNLAQLRQEIQSIRAAAADSAGGLQGQVGSSDSTAKLAKLAELKLAFDSDAQASRDAGQPEVADKVSALADQIDMVVQRNTLEGVGTNDSGTDPTVNMEQRALDAGSMVSCPSP